MDLLLCVSGGIAAYKACEFVSRARKAGHRVRVAMTANATRFVGPVTFEALAEYPVMLDTFAGPEAGAVDHVAWAKWPQGVVVAPATANLLAKMACGIADDAVTTLLLAVPEGIPVLLAPAMNTAMWEHPATRRNLGLLGEMERHHLAMPGRKRLACGDVGTGAMQEPEALLARIESLVRAASA